MHLLGGVLFCLLIRGPDGFKRNRHADGGVHPPPNSLVLPVVALLNAEHGGIKRRVDFSAVHHSFCFAVDFIADGSLIPTGGGDKKIQRLATGVAGVLGHGVEQFPGLLGEQFVENQPRHVEALLGFGFGGEHPVEAVGVGKDDPLGGRNQLGKRPQVGALLHHGAGGVEHDGRLIDVGGAGVDLRARFAVGEQQIQGDGGGQLRLAVFLAHLHISGAELPVPVRVHNPKKIPDNLLLPRHQAKRPAVPFAGGVPEHLNKIHREVGPPGVIMAGRQHQRGRCILKSAHRRNLLFIKMRAKKAADCFCPSPFA